jgi:hypothetical protein
MPEQLTGDVTAPAFADYVHDITNQLARAARDFEMEELERALHNVCEIALSEAKRLNGSDRTAH